MGSRHPGEGYFNSSTEAVAQVKFILNPRHLVELDHKARKGNE